MLSGGALVAIAPSANALPIVPLIDGFQLDGNTTPDVPYGTPATLDWNNVLNTCSTPVYNAGIWTQPSCPIGTVHVKDFYVGSGLDDAFKLGSKDILDPNIGATAEWNWENFQTPDKNDLTDVFARATDDNIYLGALRYASSGTAYLGFWLYRQAVATKCVTPSNERIFVDTNPASLGQLVQCTPVGGVSGTYHRLVHSVGDVLVLINYENGGSNTTPVLYEWNPAAPNSLRLLSPVTSDCITATNVTNVCATSNSGDINLQESIYGYTPKSGTVNTAAAGSFFEAGISRSVLSANGATDSCFSSIIGETRSSSSVTAELKDFAGGSFASCHITVDKSGPTIGKVGNNPADLLNYRVNVTNDGGSALYLSTISDTIAGNLLGAPNAGVSNVVSTCGSSGTILAAGASCLITYSYKAKLTDPDPLLNTITVTYKGKADLTGTAITGTDGHTVNLFQPGVGITKVCDALSKVGDPAHCLVTVTNTGSSDSPLSVFDSLTDSVVGDLLGTPNVHTTVTLNSCVIAGVPIRLSPSSSCSVGYDYIVQPGDPDPLVNVATVHMHPLGFPNDLTNDDTATINLFQPDVEIDKTCDGLSKVGDPLSCTITITNISSSDSPDLTNGTINDSIAGDLFGTPAVRVTIDTNTCVSVPGSPVNLAPAAVCAITYHFTVLVTDPDPLVNIVVVHYNPAGFPNDITDDDDATTELFQPGISVVKSCDEKSKIGDDANCTVTATNTSSNDSPNLMIDSAIDTVVGNLNGALTRGTKVVCPAWPIGGLAPGGVWTCSYKFTVLVTDPDPLINVATVHTHPAGFPNDIWGEDSATINLFQPGIIVDKTCDALSKIGDPLSCEITITNTSSSDSPSLTNGTINDSIAGDLFGTPATRVTIDTNNCVSVPGSPVNLAPSAVCTITYHFTVLVTDSDPLINTVVVHYNPAGFPNDITDDDSSSTNLFQPGISVDKSCDALSKVGDDANCTVTATNTSSSDSPNLIIDSAIDTLVGELNGTLSRGTKVVCPAYPVAGLAPGGVWSCSYKFTVLVTDPDPLINVATVHTHPAGFPNDITDNDDAIINLFQPGISVDKTCSPLSKIGDPVNCTVTATNTSSSDSPNLMIDSAIDTVVGNLNGALTRGTKVVCPAYPVAGLAVGAVWSCSYSFTVLNTESDPLINVATVHTHPLNFPNDITDNDDATINLFQPGISVDKTCSPLSKIGDPVNCTVTATNTSSSDSPNLMIDSAIDTVVGNLNGTLTRGTKVVCPAYPVSGLASGAVWSCSYTFTVLNTDSDPLLNRVTIHTHPLGFPNDIWDDGEASVNLFQPGIRVDKTCSPLSKIGDPVNCTVTATNIGSSDSPNLMIDSAIDTVVGNLNGALTRGTKVVCPAYPVAGLAVGAVWSCSYTFTVLLTDRDLNGNVVNTATIHTHPLGFTNDIWDDATATVNLFEPGIGVTKVCSPLSKIGDPVNCMVTATNTSSNDSPNLMIDSAIDTVVGNLNGTLRRGTKVVCPAYPVGGLAPGAVWSCSYSFNVLSSDSDPLLNTVTIHTHPLNFPNDIWGTASASVNLFQPGIGVTKVCSPLSKIGDPVDCTVTATNIGSSDSPNLMFDSANDTVVGNLNGTLRRGTKVVCPAYPVAGLAVGAAWSCSYTFNVLSSDSDPLINTVTIRTHPLGFTNDIRGTASASVNLFQPGIGVTKVCSPLSKIGDPVNCLVTATNIGSSDSPNLMFDSANDTVVGNLNGVLTRGTKVVCPAYPVAGLAVGAAWSCSYTFNVLNTDSDPLINTVTIRTHPLGFTNDIRNTATAIVNLFQPSLGITKVVTPTSAVVGQLLTYTVTVTNISSSDSPNLIFDSATGTRLYDTIAGDLLVAPLTRGSRDVTSTCAPGTSLPPAGSCFVRYTYPILLTDPNPLVNTVSTLMHPTGFPNNITGTASASVAIKHPGFTVVKECISGTTPITSGTVAIFSSTITNTGDVPLNFVAKDVGAIEAYINVNGVDVSIVATFGGANPPGYAFRLAPAASLLIYGIAIPLAVGLTTPNNVEVTATADAPLVWSETKNATSSCVNPIAGATRTPGFWKTHVAFTTHIFRDALGSRIDLGWRVLTTPAQIFGMYEASRTQTTTGASRSTVCRARVRGSFHLLSAILNSGLTNGKAIPVDTVTGLTLIVAMRNALTAGNLAEIQRLQGPLDAYNNSGDSVGLLDAWGIGQGKASPSLATSIADLTIADC